MTAADPTLESLIGVPRSEPMRVGRIVVGVAVATLVVFMVRAFALGEIEWSWVARYLTAYAILVGFANTLIMTAGAMALGIALGLAAALMGLSEDPTTRAVAKGYVWFFRGIPIYLQLLLWFNLALVFPTLGIPGLAEVRTVDAMTPFLAALLGLGVCQGAYTAEVIRAGILSGDVGQIEAARAVGMRRGQVMRHIVLPQTLRIIAPPIGNEVIGMLKHSSIAAVIGYQEVMHTASMLHFVNNRVIEMLIVCSIWYLVTVTLLTIGQSLVERRLGRSLGRRTAAAPVAEEGAGA